MHSNYLLNLRGHPVQIRALLPAALFWPSQDNLSCVDDSNTRVRRSESVLQFTQFALAWAGGASHVT